MDYIGNIRFDSGIPVGAFTCWAQLLGEFFEARIAGEGGNHAFDVYIGGPLENTITEIPPVPANLEFQVYSDADPTFFVPDTSVLLNGGDPLPAFSIPYATG